MVDLEFWRPYLVFGVFQIIIWILFMCGCHELDERDDTVTDLGEEPMEEYMLTTVVVAVP